MPLETASELVPEPRSHMLDEAVRRVIAAVPGEVDQPALRRAIETEMVKGPRSLTALVKVGRRRAIDRVARVRGKARP